MAAPRRRLTAGSWAPTQLVPEFLRYCDVQHRDGVVDFRAGPCADDDGTDRRVAARELQRRRPQGHIVFRADPVHCQCAFDDGALRWLIVEGRRVQRVGQNSAVQHATHEYSNAASRTFGKQLDFGPPVQQGVPARDQQVIDGGFADESQRHIHIVDPDTDAGDDAFGPHADEFGRGGGAGFVW